MYCSNCGLAVSESLSYCNHCGARIGASNKNQVGVSREIKPELLIHSMVSTFVIGLLAITVLLGVMKAVLGLELGQILGFAALSFLIMLFLEGVFVLLLFRRNRDTEKRDKTELLTSQTTKELGAPQAPVGEPVSSVTDHTTRAFEPIYTDRNNAT